MSLTARLKANLVQAREMTEGIFATLKSPEEWTHQVHPKANHALWIAGHLGHADNFFISMIAPEKAVEKEGWGEAFGMGSQPTSDASAYPSVEEVLAYFRERRETMLAIVDSLSEEDLAKKTPEGSPDFMSDYEQTLEMALWHEGIHTGQLTVAHRSLGHSPLFAAPQPADA